MPTTATTQSLGARAKSALPQSLGQFVKAINWPLLATTAALVVCGLTVVYSAVHGRDNFSFNHQVLGVALGLACMLGLWLLDYRVLASLTVPLYIVIVLLILSPLVPGLGVVVNNARNWIKIFGQQIQPAEFAKILTIMGMASMVARYRGKLQSGREYLKCFALMMLPVVCVIMQPDLGTGLVFLAIGFAILFCGGANRWYLAITVICGIAAIICILLLDPILDARLGHDVLLKEYQINRLLVFLNEDLDPTGLGYNLRQAKIAIGSGGWSGAGFMQGTQSSLGFLPEAPTDFIFCVLAEEFGFMGSLSLLVLYALLVLISLQVAFRADAFGALLISGCLGLWVFQILENIGMTCGLMPITGIPLPFMSYGSSFMVVNFCAIGLVLSVHLRTVLDSKPKTGLETGTLRKGL